jgi:rSAM/selenodomain-associated transferase 1
MGDWQVAILARAALPGAAKTRLIPRLGAERAARLQAHLTERAVMRAHEAGARVVLWLAGAADAATLQLARRFAAEVRDQPPGDLGDRMLAATRVLNARGLPGVVIGTDCPAQQPDHLQQARALLGQHDVVLQPALDGGYVLIGTAVPQPLLFGDVAWGTSSVLATTRQRCVTLGLRCAELPPLPDLDLPEDLDAAIASGWLDRERWS